MPNIFDDEYVVFDFKNKTMFSPKDSVFFATTVFALVVPYKYEVDAWTQMIAIEKWLNKKDNEISVITVKDALDIIGKNNSPK